MVFTACLCVQSGAAIHNINTVCILLCMDVYVYARTCVHVYMYVPVFCALTVHVSSVYYRIMGVGIVLFLLFSSSI